MFSSNGTQVSSAATFIEDVFSCFLHTGTGVAQTITNGIDLSTYGGLVWLKCRGSAFDNELNDTVRGITKDLISNGAFAESTNSYVTSVNSSGFSISTSATVNQNNNTYVSWTFREQPKFFDIVTWTGNATNRTIAHALGAIPGCIIVKRTDTSQAWAVYHRSLTNTQYLVLNDTAAAATGATWWNSTTPTSTVFSVGTDASVNASAGTYVAYIFAHDAGGFGLAGTDNVISCGSFAAAGVLTYVELGYEPQWVLVKSVSGADPVQNWYTIDTMRGMSLTGTTKLLPNTSAVESNPAAGNPEFPAATGMYLRPSGSGTYIYIAIRRGPMKVPTLGTSVFGLSARSGTGADATVTGGQTDDAVLIKNRGSAVASLFSSRLTGTGYLVTSSQAAEVAAGVTILQANPWDVMDGVKVGTTSTITNASANTFINYFFKRAPGFFDEVCYTGTGSDTTQTHNLGVVPELILFKCRSTTGIWFVYSAGTTVPNNYYLRLETTGAQANAGSQVWNNTSTTFLAKTGLSLSDSGQTYVAYLFATIAGVSKIGSYTGTGTTKQVDCGFTAGARFILIKRTDSLGDWYVWDSARGIVAGNDPYLFLNSTAAEVTGTDYVDTYSAGFEISSTAPADINSNGGSFIFLAIA
jgi:hypothetical protein